MARAELERLEEALDKAEGPSRELDAWIVVATTPARKTDDDLIYLRRVRKDDGCSEGTYWLHQRSGASLHTAPELTDSVDDVLALAQSLLPGARMCAAFGDNYSHAWFVRGWGVRAQNFPCAPERDDDQHALAICASLVRALIAQEGADHDR